MTKPDIPRRARAKPAASDFERADQIVSEWDEHNGAFTMRELLAEALADDRRKLLADDDETIEAMAREFCAAHGLDPDLILRDPRPSIRSDLTKDERENGVRVAQWELHIIGARAALAALRKKAGVE